MGKFRLKFVPSLTLVGRPVVRLSCTQNKGLILSEVPSPDLGLTC